MIFFTDNTLRTAFVRTAGTVVALLFAGAIVLFVLDVPGPSNTCVGCTARARATLSSGTVPEHVVAITFDDGPHPEATPLILDTLDKHGEEATFFLLGALVVQNTHMAKAIIDRGNEIGNHSYTHAMSEQQSKEALTWELNMNTKLIEAVTGHTPLMYRPPYLNDLNDFELVPDPALDPVWGWVDEAGYIPIGSDLDSLDWQVTTPEGVLANVDKIIEVKRSAPDKATRHVLLFHDQPHTAAALDEAIVRLKAAGLEIVPLSTLLGLRPEHVMPTVTQTPAHVAYQMLLTTMRGMFYVLTGAVLVLTVLSLARFIVFLYARLALVPARKISTNRAPASVAALRVSVLVPAHNESKNIRATLLSIVKNTRLPHEILVINDGSTDDTERYAHEVAQHYPGLVHVLSYENRGKASALNAGIARATGDILIAIDGDTVLDKRCIEAVVQPFDDPRVAAVAGKIVPASQAYLLEKYQALEYVVGQHMDRAILSHMGAVNIVPGAIGAWRALVLRAVGGYSKDTLVEDQDLTLAVLARGYKVEFAPNAVAYTEVPRVFSQLLRQRFRWTYGTFQCMWKYRGHFFDERAWRLAWVALPYSLVFNVLLPIVAVFLYIAMAAAITMRLSFPAVWFLFVFTLLDLVYASVALLYERGAKWRLLPHILLQRFVYIGLYAYLALRACIKVLDGSRTQWNTLVRHGNAEALFLRTLDTPTATGDVVLPHIPSLGHARAAITSRLAFPGSNDTVRGISYGAPVTTSFQGPLGTSAASMNVQ